MTDTIPVITLSPETILALESTGTRVLYASVPDEMKDILSGLASRWRADRWAVGDITNGVASYVDANHVVASREDVYFFVSELLNNELSPRTVRYYARMSDFFAPDIRDEYSELPHTHFALALKYEAHWKEILDASLNEFYKWGKCPSTEWLEANICNKFVSTEPPEEVNPPVDVDEEDELENKESEVNASHPFIRGFLKALSGLTKLVETYVNKDSAKRIISLVESLEDELNSL